jgi:hypothetical protein
MDKEDDDGYNEAEIASIIAEEQALINRITKHAKANKGEFEKYYNQTKSIAAETKTPEEYLPILRKQVY